MKRIVLLTILMTLTFTAAYADTMSARQLFASGNLAYNEGDYETAVEKYETILAQEVDSAAVNYNLGNSYFKQGKLGKAILHYERARRLSPRDSDIEANYRYARSQVINSAENRSFFIRLFPHIEKVTVDEIVWILTFITMVVGAIYLAFQFFPMPRKRTMTLMGVLSLVLLFHVFALMLKVNMVKDKAVILQKVQANFEPSAVATTHFSMTPGRQVKILKEKEGWVKIKRSDGKVGWVQAQGVEAF